jgi:mono/diheme cytochrome c family protein
MVHLAFKALLLSLLVLGLVFLWLTRADPLQTAELSYAEPDPVNGELVFHAASCAACHGADLSGGHELNTEFGMFRAPNISPDPESGIGNWSTTEFLNAIMRGVSPDGQHYYPSFPYTSYARMNVQDVVDLKAYMDGLPPVQNKVAAHQLGFPWNIRRGIGLWKQRYLSAEPVVSLPESAEPELQRGRYLVEGPGHCGECHTERDALGGLRLQRWLAGAPNPDGEGKIPDITPTARSLSQWSAKDIAYYLDTGFTPDFDTVGGSMVAVQENLARLSPEDRAAMAAYLKALPVKVLTAE